MSFTEGESASELSAAETPLWSHIFNFLDSISLKCAVELGIFQVIENHGKPMPLSELVAALFLHQNKTHCVYRLMRLLVHSGFFVVNKVQNCGQEEEEEYLLTSASRLLLKLEPMRSSRMLPVLDPVVMTPCQSLSTWLQQNNNPTSFEMANGRSFYDHMSYDSYGFLFNKHMATESEITTNVMLRDCKEVFEGLESPVDVGGGTGMVAKAIADAFPRLNCTVLDLPQVVANLQGTENLHFIGGSMFEAIPPANAVLLKRVLHSYNDEDSIKILKQCKEAIPSKEKGGKVIIVDMSIKNNSEVDEQLVKTQLYADMLMMVLLNGKERTEQEWETLFNAAAAFSHYKITPMSGLLSIIELYP